MLPFQMAWCATACAGAMPTLAWACYGTAPQHKRRHSAPKTRPRPCFAWYPAWAWHRTIRLAIGGALAACVTLLSLAYGQSALALPSRSEDRAGNVARFEGHLNGLEQALFADAADGRLDEHSLLEAALVASGVEDFETLRLYQERLATLVEPLSGRGTVPFSPSEDWNSPPAGTPRQQAEAVFAYMHCRILRGGYRLDCTDLRQALDHGYFNCVSATVLYNCLAEAGGLTVCGLASPGHAMTRLLLPEGPLDVETTCPAWFRLMHDPKQQAAHVAETLGSAAATDRANAREVSPIQLVAMIYYNRGVDLLGEKQFAAAAAANAKALRLDPTSETASGNLLATINNWAIALGTDRHYAEAAALLRRGMAIDPAYETFMVNYRHICREWRRTVDGRR